MPIFEDDCYADLIWNGERPPAIYAMSQHGGVIHIGSFSKSIAPALRVGFIVAPWEMMSRMLALKTDAGSGALEQMVLAEYCAPHFSTHVPKLTRGAARQARHADGSAQRTVRHRGRVRGSQGRHLPVGEAARQSVDTHEALSGRARRRRRHQSRTGMVDRQGLLRQPAAAVLCQPLARGDPRRASPLLAEVCRKEFGVPERIANVEKRVGLSLKSSTERFYPFCGRQCASPCDRFSAPGRRGNRI